MSIREVFKSNNMVRIILNKLILISVKYPEIFSETLHFLEEKIKERNTKKVDVFSIISKNQYVAIVGLIRFEEIILKKIIQDAGFSFKKFKIINDLNHYKNGNGTDILESPNCIAIIFGEVPHSSSHNVQNLENVRTKSIIAKTNSGERKITKESLEKSLEKLRDFISEKNLKTVA